MAIVHLPTAMVSYKCTDALDDKGYVLQINSDGTVSKCAAGTRPFGVAYKDTKNPITDVAEANRYVPVILHGVALVRYNLASTDPSIAIGDWVGMKGANAAGEVKKFVEGDTTTAWPATYAASTAETITDEIITVIREYDLVVGIALEAVSAPATGTKQGRMKVLIVRV